jgi:putative aldouronate transport system permease protein
MFATMQKREKARIKDSASDRIFYSIIVIILGIIAVIVLYPLLFILSASISDPNAVNSGRIWLFPVGIQFSGYISIFKSKWVLVGYRNNLLYLLFGTALNVFVTYTGAYALSRKDIYGRKLLTFYIVFTMWFSGGLIPTFLVMRSVGLIDSPLTLVIFGAVNAYNFIICRTFIQSSIPGELQEAARIDGCSDFGICWRIVFPLSKPVLAVLVLYYGLEHWNSYFPALMYLNKREMQPLQIFLREILLQNQIVDINSMDLKSVQELSRMTKIMKYSLIVVASVPMVILYPFLQRYFVQGVMDCSIKG